MTPEEFQQLGEELAKIYFRRRTEYFAAIDLAIKARRGPELIDYVLASEDKDRAAARWDQTVEITNIFPIQIRQPMLEAVERLSM